MSLSRARRPSNANRRRSPPPRGASSRSGTPRVRVEQADDDVLDERNLRFDDDDRRELLHEPCQLADRSGRIGLRVKTLQQAMAEAGADRLAEQDGDECLGNGEIALGQSPLARPRPPGPWPCRALPRGSVRPPPSAALDPPAGDSGLGLAGTSKPSSNASGRSSTISISPSGFTANVDAKSPSA